MNIRVSAALLLLCAFGAIYAQGPTTAEPEKPPTTAEPEKPPLQVIEDASFCKGLRCPAYATADKVEEDRPGRRNLRLEERMYVNPTRWVRTSMDVDSSSINWWGRLWNNYEGKLFSRLFDYIGGENEWGMKIDMTAPVLIRYEDKGYGRSEIMMFFYVANKDQVPRPNNPEVEIFDLPGGQRALVRSFRTWFVTAPWSWDQNVNMLKDSVETVYKEMPGRFPEVKPTVYFHVGYDGPWTWGSRHNEVWMEFKDDMDGGDDAMADDGKDK